MVPLVYYIIGAKFFVNTNVRRKSKEEKDSIKLS